MHWHQPHTWSEITRAGLETMLSDDAERSSWYVGDDRRTADRRARCDRGCRLRRFVEGVEQCLPKPHDPLHAIDKLARFDRLSIAERVAQLELTDEERAVLWAELEFSPMARSRRPERLWYPVARAVGLQPRAHAVHGQPRDARRRHRCSLQAIVNAAPLEVQLSTPVALVRRLGTGSRSSLATGRPSTQRPWSSRCR